MGAPSVRPYDLPCKGLGEGRWGVEEGILVHHCTTLVRVCFVIVCQCVDVDLCEAICKITRCLLLLQVRRALKSLFFVSLVGMVNKV